MTVTQPTVSASRPDIDQAMIRAADGDQEAFASVYDALAPGVLGVIRAILRDPAMSEEVAQDVFVEAWDSAGRFDPARGSAAAWVYTMARRRAVDRVRSEEASRRRTEEVGAASLAPESDVTSSAVVTREEHAAVRSALGALTDLQRDAIVRAYFGGRTYREVAEELDVPLGTVKTRMRDGLLRLAEEMGGSP